MRTRESYGSGREAMRSHRAIRHDPAMEVYDRQKSEAYARVCDAIDVPKGRLGTMQMRMMISIMSEEEKDIERCPRDPRVEANYINYLDRHLDVVRRLAERGFFSNIQQLNGRRDNTNCNVVAPEPEQSPLWIDWGFGMGNCFPDVGLADSFPDDDMTGETDCLLWEDV